MKLTDVLKKTQNKAIDTSIKRTPPSIAYKERPYKLEDASRINLNSEEEQISDWEQSGNKPVTKPVTKEDRLVSASQISGLQRKLLILIYQECKNARMKNTNSLTLDYISSVTKTSQGVAKTTLRRLENKNCIMRKEYKNGRGGWTKYELREDLFQELLQLEKSHQLEKNREESGNKFSYY